ncbi:hypothetical protein [Bradyrhizobium sp. BR 1432]|uniref:hypothetical protein n=1 Tax=Bradyrhizobium sp. BR 1432 TaxID=3447966 RepID=UPI003EE49CDA
MDALYRHLELILCGAELDDLHFDTRNAIRSYVGDLVQGAIAQPHDPVTLRKRERQRAVSANCGPDVAASPPDQIVETAGSRQQTPANLPFAPRGAMRAGDE